MFSIVKLYFMEYYYCNKILDFFATSFCIFALFHLHKYLHNFNMNFICSITNSFMHSFFHISIRPDPLKWVMVDNHMHLKP